MDKTDHRFTESVGLGISSWKSDGDEQVASVIREGANNRLRLQRPIRAVPTLRALLDRLLTCAQDDSHYVVGHFCSGGACICPPRALPFARRQLPAMNYPGVSVAAMKNHIAFSE